jgi:hypothetical protein
MSLLCRVVDDYDDLSREFHVYGPADQLRQLVHLHAHAGTLVHATAPAPTTGDRAMVQMRVRNSIVTGGAPRPLPPGMHFTEQPAPAQTTTGSNRRTRTAVIITAITGTTAGLVAAAYLLGQLVELITAHAGLILAVLALAATLAVTAVRRRSSGRRHCPGC